MVDWSKLKSKIRQENDIAEKLYLLVKDYESGKKTNESKANINALIDRMKIINKEFSENIDNIVLTRPLPKSSFVERPTQMAFSKEDKNLEEMKLQISSLKRAKKEIYKPKEREDNVFNKPSLYTKLSNKYFSNMSENMIKKGYFDSVKRDIIMAKLTFLLRSYVSIILFSTVISIFISIFLLIFLIFFELSFTFPFVSVYSGSFIGRIGQIFWVCILIPLIVFLMFYFYPSTEKNYLGRKIDEEMPFVTIQMSAIAGSNIDPSKIFEILSRSKDYPNTRKEMIFLMNKVNIYGYNLATALRDSARYCSSKKLKDVLNGLSTTITSGGELRDYLTERAKTLLFEYKLDREKQNKTAETFIDIYISVVIAAPMILMLLLILINQTGIGTFGLSNEILAVLVIGGIAMINIVFLFILHLKQPKQ